MIYVHLLSQRQPKTFFLSLQPVEHAHAQGVYEAVERAFIANEIENCWEKLVGIGCDGANVNTGRNNSVSSRIRDEHILVIHCMGSQARTWSFTCNKEFGVLCCLTTPGLRKDIRRQIRQLYSHKITYYVYYNYILSSHLLSHFHIYFYY